MYCAECRGRCNIEVIRSERVVEKSEYWGVIRTSVRDPIDIISDCCYTYIYKDEGFDSLLEVTDVDPILLNRE